MHKLQKNVLLACKSFRACLQTSAFAVPSLIVLASVTIAMIGTSWMSAADCAFCQTATLNKSRALLHSEVIDDMVQILVTFHAILADS